MTNGWHIWGSDNKGKVRCFIVALDSESEAIQFVQDRFQLNILSRQKLVSNIIRMVPLSPNSFVEMVAANAKDDLTPLGIPIDRPA